MIIPLVGFLLEKTLILTIQEILFLVREGDEEKLNTKTFAFYKVTAKIPNATRSVFEELDEEIVKEISVFTEDELKLSAKSSIFHAVKVQIPNAITSNFN